MKKRAVIDSDGNVVNIILAPANLHVAGHTLQDVGDDLVRKGDRHDGKKFVANPVQKLTADQLKEKLAELRWRFEVSGTEWNGDAIDTDRNTQAMLTGMVVLSGMQKGLKINFKTKRGFIKLDVNTIGGIAVAVAAHVQNAFDIEAGAVEAIDAGKLTTVAELKALFNRGK